MLKELRISNLALIEKLHISLGPGLTVLTGETGAGKSIVLQAIHLLSGGRTDTSWIRTGAEAATIEALFEIDPERTGLLAEIAAMGFEHDGSLLIKRVIPAAGRSRYYINAGLGTAALVGKIIAGILSVASQHEHQQLLVPRNHLDFIDTLGGHGPDRHTLATLFDQWSGLKLKYRDLLDRAKDREQRRDFLTFQINEITAAALSPGEDERLALEKNRLKAADDLRRLGGEAYRTLSETVLDGLAMVRKNIEQMNNFDQSLSDLAEQVAGIVYQLEDHASTLLAYLEDIPDDPGRLEIVAARIDLLQRLKKKYGPEIEDVIRHGEKAGQEHEEIAGAGEQLEKMQKDILDLEERLVKQADRLSGLRELTAARIGPVMENEIKSLSFANAEFEINLNSSRDRDLSELTRSGWERPEFRFSANAGEPAKPLAGVASGGELSRIMLALRCLLAAKDRVETVIFDEVDAGISGKAAEAVARKIKELADHHQVLCITHLPQIASRADDHFKVEKITTGDRTSTNVTRLPDRERIEELAHMLDGASVTAKTREYARELLERNR